MFVMAEKIIVGNWKANPESLREAKRILTPVRRAMGKLKQVEAVICPPAVWLGELSGGRTSGSRGSTLKYPKVEPRIRFGAQDAFWETGGAYTGMIGPTMVRNSGASHLIIGHSERRQLGDTDEVVNAKVRLALKHDLKVILCVGEKERDERGDYLKILETQLKAALAGVPRRRLGQLLVAYEPVWAIGERAKQSDTPPAFLEQAIFLRKVLADAAGKEFALALPVLYGGSATAENARGFLSEGRADGLLVGRASLDAEQFIKILRLADELG